MLKRLYILALFGLAGCAHRGAGGWVAPEPPAPEQADAQPAQASDSGPPVAAAAAAARARAPRGAGAPPPATTVSPAKHDTSTDAAFLDTLQTLNADSALAQRPAPSAPAAPTPTVRADSAPLMAPHVLEAVTAPVAPPPPAEAAATWDIQVDKYVANERVQYYLDYFRTRGRDHFEVYLARLGRYEALVRAKLQAAHLPQDLVYLALIESGMNPNAVSRRRAVGMWQFIAATGKRYGLTVDPWVDERRDPWLATDAAIRMISELTDRFGSLYLAAAAYNAGPGKIQRGLNRYDFGEVQRNDLYFALADERFLRRETRDYVPKLIAAALICKQPEKWGFDHIERWDPLHFDSMQVTGAVGLDVLARLADTTVDAVEELNPQLVRDVTPPGRTVWVRMPAGRGDSAAARLAVLPPERRLTHVDHYVSRGETLGEIAMAYHVSVNDILAANRGVRARSLRPGQRLVIPTSRRSRAGSVGYASAEPPRRRAAASRPRYLLSTAARLPEDGSRRVHIVQPGESPWTISRQFQVPLDALLKENGLTKRSLIKPGQSIRIPS
jgi:membrane-bound lytic murein transglycosylase D